MTGALSQSHNNKCFYLLKLGSEHLSLQLIPRCWSPGEQEFLRVQVIKRQLKDKSVLKYTMRNKAYK